MVFSFSAMIWFSILTKLRSMNKISETCMKISILYISCIVCSEKQRVLLKQSYLKNYHSSAEEKTVIYLNGYNSVESECDNFEIIANKRKKKLVTSSEKDRRKRISNMLKKMHRNSESESNFDLKSNIQNKRIKFLTKEQIITEIFYITNRVVFLIFLLFIINLNLIILVVCPFYIKSPHDIPE